MKKKLKKILKNIFDFFLNFFLSIFKSPSSRKETVWFPDSPNYENLPDFWTGRDVW